MKYLDRDLGRAIVQKELDSGELVVSADFVLIGDELWNTETFYEDGGFCDEDLFACHYCSTWATPAVVIHYKDGKEKRINCYFNEKDDPDRANEIEDVNALNFDDLLTNLE